jgi:hypothetical protein
MNLATPFQFDSISLPAWTDTAIRHTRQAAVHSRIVLKAFSKTIAPVIATTTKEVGRYYWSCFQGAEKWTLDRQPISSAVRAVHAELVSAEAKATYSLIGKLMHERLINGLVIAHYGIAALIIGFTTAQSAYRTAAKLSRAVYGRLNPSEPTPELLPSVGMAKAQVSVQAIVLQLVEAVEDVPDFWAESLPLFHTPPVVGVVWNPAPGRNMHEEVRRLFELQHVPLTLPAPMIEQPAPEPVLEQKPDPEAMDELATVLDVPGAKLARRPSAVAKPKRERKPKAMKTRAKAK